MTLYYVPRLNGPCVLMNRLLLFAALLLCASLTSCQCADPPDVGPVEDEESTAQVLQVAPETLPVA